MKADILFPPVISARRNPYPLLTSQALRVELPVGFGEQRLRQAERRDERPLARPSLGLERQLGFQYVPHDRADTLAQPILAL